MGLGGGLGFGTLLAGGATGALGIIAVDWAFTLVRQAFPRIASPGTIVYPVLKILAASLVGKTLGSLTGSRRFGDAATMGAVTVIVYNQLGLPLARQMNIPLGRYVAMRGLGNGVARRSFLRTHRLMGRRPPMYMGHMSPARIVRMRGLNRFIRMRGFSPVNPNRASIPSRVGNLARFIRTE